MATDDLIAALQGAGRVESVGSFSFDREKAREKLRTFQVAEPQRYVLHLVALATLKGASQLEIECDSDDLIARFDGAPITAEDLDDLYNSSFAAAHTDHQRARQQLAIGLHAALALNPRHVRLISGAGEGAVTMLARHDEADVIGTATAATPGTQIHVKQRFRPGLVVRFVRHLRGTLAEATWLRERGRYASLPITLNGERISEGLVLADAEHVQRGEQGSCRGVAGLLPASGGCGVIRLVRHGVWICDEAREWLPDGLVAVVASDRLLTDLSGDKVVQDEEHARALALGVSLAAEVVARAIGPGEAVELEAGLLTRLRPVWRKWPGALAPRTVIGEAMARVVAFTDLWGRRCTLGMLRAQAERVGHLAVTDGDFAELLSAREELVIRSGDAFVDSVLAMAFGERRRDVSTALRRDMQIEARRRRWRAQPCEATLNPGNYVLVAPLVVTLGDRQVVGEVGVRRVASEVCALRVIVDGCSLVELELAAPIAGVDAVISGPLVVADDCSGPVQDELFAAALAGWLASARVLAETALRRGLVVWGPGPAMQALVYGLVRAMHRSEGLRATLKAGGYDGEALAGRERALLGGLPLVHVPKDMAEEAWLRDTFAFATGAGLQLSLGAVAAGLRQKLPLAWVPEECEPHPGLSAPVLRVDGRGRDLLRWLFPGQVRRMDPEEYRRLRGEAILRARPEERFGLSQFTHLASVVVVHEGQRVAMAFARTQEGWDEATSRSTCTIFFAGRSMARATMWSPVLGVSYAIAGDALTPKPSWDAMVPDDAYFAALQRAAAAVPALVRRAIEEVAADPSGEEGLAWRRGLLAALAASFLTPALRDVHARLVAEYGPAGMSHYERLLALASLVTPATFTRQLAELRDNLGLLVDTRSLAASLSLPPPTAAQVSGVSTVLGELRSLLGQSGGATWLDDVLRCTPELAALPLFARVDGRPVSLAEATAQAQAGGLHIHVNPGERRPAGFLRSLRVDAVTRELLACLYGEHRLKAEPIAAPREPEAEAVVSTRRRPRAAAPVDEVSEDPPPTAADLAALFAALETEARTSRPPPVPQPAPVVADVVVAPRPEPAPPSPDDRLISALRAELDALRRGHESLLSGFNLDHVRATRGRSSGAVSIGLAGLQVHVSDPLVQRAIAGHADDPVLVSFLVSRVYTALNLWREDITDVDERSFHARHLAWLAERGGS
ncbi:MAG: hypothetical protein IPO88_03000 [Nannocystis sp.]|uniref:hypothetical protein n=1 Tax=Nannocystis sp. TaxID=1962667 RepID=UPI002425F4CA|nr:hypothetical protein [Nannocystis sp.]MBK9752471.1 hypothetical protein [Nannocystis sp.]